MVVDRHQTDLYVRPSWLDAAIALRQIEKGNAEGSRSALWFRSRLQKQLFQLGCFLQRHAGKVLFVAVLVLASFCVGLKSAIMHSRADQLWIEEGGRLERELKYVESALGESTSYTHQLIIQTPKDSTASLLHPDALLTHLKAIKTSASVTVHLFNVPWKLKDICYSPNFSTFDTPFVDNIFRDIIPCTIITPLDCFWEGSKLLGPDLPVTVPYISQKIKWTTLNPKNLLDIIKSVGSTSNFPLKTLEEIMKRAGITTGYQEKPCLNPKDRECPNTAPNKNSTHRLDVGTQLAGGCYGFASKYMHWPEDLIVGGAKKSKSGQIQKAHALQSVLQLMGERELYEYYVDSYKVHHIDWTSQKAALVLETWQKKFSEELRKYMRTQTEDVEQYNIYSFSTATLNDILSHFSKIDVKKIVIGYLIMLIYVALYLFRWKDPILSQTVVGIAGVLLLIVTIAAALGLCAVFGIAFNASTTQIVPFLGLGLGVIDMFLLTNVYAHQSPTEGHLQKQTGNVLKKGGLSVLLTSLSIISSFGAAIIIPIPALRVFSLQAAILVFFNLVTLLVVFPAIIAIDLRRRRAGRVDIFCCCCIMPTDNGNWPCLESSPTVTRKIPVTEKKQAITCALPPDRQQTVTVLAAAPSDLSIKGTSKRDNSRILRSLLSDEIEKSAVVPVSDDDIEQQQHHHQQQQQQCRVVWSLDYAIEWYGQFLCRRVVKVFSVLLFVFVLAVSIWNVSKIVYGLDLSDVVPQNTNEHQFLTTQERYFGFYNMYAITQGDFEYPTNQKLLYDYHEAFTRVPNIIKNDNGGLPQFWLGLFRDWLLGLQRAFDKDWAQGCITQETWFQNASDEGILGYKLLVQTGYVENPVDRSLVPQARLVDNDGMINPDAFYNYLSAWVCHDALAYSASQANFKPEPKYWCHAPNDFELRVPKSSPLVYAQIPFYLQGLSSTTQITKLIGQVRDVCQRFEARGLPNFPNGIPFQFWEQYRELWQYLTIAALCALGSVFCIVAFLLLNFWAAFVVTLESAAMVLQLFGAFSAIGVKLNAVPAVLLVVSIGFNMHFIIHLCYNFLTVIGNKKRRLELAMKHTFPIILHATITTLLAAAMLAFNEFDFIVRYFFNVLIALIGIGFLNSCLLFPILLLLIGPQSEVKPTKYLDRIGTPSPEPVKRVHRNLSYRHATLPPSRRHREPSLSTITEEPGSWHSTAHEIVMEPELVVETTTCTHPHSTSAAGGNNSSNENESSCSSSPASIHRTIPSSSANSSSSTSTSSLPPPMQSTTHVTTKVTATAKFKVEVHTPIHTTYERSSHRHSSRRRDSTSSTSTSTTECSSKHYSDNR